MVQNANQIKERSTTIPLRGSSTYKDAVKAVAASRRLDMCDLVRLALDAYCGEQLKQQLTFFAEDGSKNFQLETENVIKTDPPIVKRS